MIVVRKDIGRVEISFPYSQNYIAKIKTMDGYRWHPEGKYWSVPYSELEKLLSVFDGESIVIDPIIYLDELKKELVVRKYKPENWLFMGIKPEKHISTRTVQAIFEQACEKAGLTKVQRRLKYIPT